MNNLPLFDHASSEDTIPVSLLIEHVLLRSAQSNDPIIGFDLPSVTAWLLDYDQAFNTQTLLPDDLVTEQGCRAIVNTIENMNLARLVHIDLTVLFAGRNNVLQMLNSSLSLSTGDLIGSGPFNGLSFNPPGDTEEHTFDNGAIKISSLYLAAVSQELHREGKLGGSKPPDTTIYWPKSVRL